MNHVLEPKEPSSLNTWRSYLQDDSFHDGSAGSSMQVGSLPKPQFRKFSSASCISISTIESGSHHKSEENKASRVSTLHQSSLRSGSDCLPPFKESSSHISRRSSWGTEIPPPSHQRRPTALEVELDNLEEVDLNEDQRNSKCQQSGAAAQRRNQHSSEISDRRPVSDLEEVRSELEEDHTGQGLEPRTRSAFVLGAHFTTPRDPFRRWMSTLRRRRSRRRKTVYHPRAPSLNRAGDDLPYRVAPSIHPRRKKSSSVSSTGFVTAVKSASISLASFGIAPQTRRLKRASEIRSDDRNSRSSNRPARLSDVESDGIAFSQVDEKTWHRAVQRRRILEELISSEESYVADLKILADVPLLSAYSVYTILNLHEVLLGELHKAVPNSEYTQESHSRLAVVERRRNGRWRSLDADLEDGDAATAPRKERHSIDVATLTKLHRVGIIAEPKVAADVALVFDKLMRQFFVYEEYGAKYDKMVQDVASTFSTSSTSLAYEKGIEALAASVASINKRAARSRKGLAFQDLLIKVRDAE
ncbi:MAG: hypothetical protein M1837_000587 [Sclerophora amabilis]|nr:MAG: hypothetical protein M1837_000587 [Sclerophora amabilis]